MDQTNLCVYGNDNQGSATQIVMTPGAGVFMVGRGLISHLIKINALFPFKKYSSVLLGIHIDQTN